jgi:DNA helicase-2/ATP-dependent DNA helicase PcrA
VQSFSWVSTANCFKRCKEQTFRPIVEMLVDGLGAEEVMEALRATLPSLGARRPNRLTASKHAKRLEELDLLGERLRRGNLVPGMTVHQAKGREWPRVGVVLTKTDIELLSEGLKPLTDEHCILYVALTRAMERCGRIGAVESESSEPVDTI